MEVKDLKNDLDVVNKFRSYRSEAKITDKKLKEANSVIDQFKREIKTSRDVELNLREQVSSAQIRLIQLQSTISKFILISEQQRENDKICQSVNEKVEELSKMIFEAKEKVNSLGEKATKEVELMKANESLKSAIKSKECENDLLKMENQSIIKEKYETSCNYEQKLKTLNEEVDRLKRECEDVKINCKSTLQIYEKQIEENQQLIKEFQKERRGRLEEFQPPEGESQNFNDFMRPDSTVEESSKNRIFSKEQQIDTDIDIFTATTSSDIRFKISPKLKNSKTGIKINKFQQSGNKQKAQLNFLTPRSQESLERNENGKPPPKRRLFSTNYNRYID